MSLSGSFRSLTAVCGVWDCGCRLFQNVDRLRPLVNGWMAFIGWLMPIDWLTGAVTNRKYCYVIKREMPFSATGTSLFGYLALSLYPRPCRHARQGLFGPSAELSDKLFAACFLELSRTLSLFLSQFYNYSVNWSSNQCCNPNLNRGVPKNNRDPSGQFLKISNMDSFFEKRWSFGYFGLRMVLDGTGWNWMVLDCTKWFSMVLNGFEINSNNFERFFDGIIRLAMSHEPWAMNH